MLVITRNPGESFELFGADGSRLAKIFFVEKCGVNKIRVGIEADPEIQIARSEIVGRPNGQKRSHTRMDQGS